MYCNILSVSRKDGFVRILNDMGQVDLKPINTDTSYCRLGLWISM